MLRAPNHVSNLSQDDTDVTITSARKPKLLTRSPSSLQVGALRNLFVVRTRPTFFRLSWLLFALIHGMTASFFAAWAWAYWTLPATFLGVSFEIYRISLPLSEFLILAVCHGAVAFSHAWILVRMIARSVYYRRFTFSAEPRRPGYTKTLSRCAIFRSDRISMVSKKVTNRVQQVFGRRGFIGIEGRNFELVYIAREIIETTLQSIQSYRTSLLIARVYINRVYVIMIFANCWSTPIALHFLEHNPPLARFICLLMDIALDFISTVGIPLTLVVPYLKTYSSQMKNFDTWLWYDDVSFVSMVGEFRLVMITTWLELISRMLFSFSMISCIENSKSLLQMDSSKVQTTKVLSTQSSCTGLRDCGPTISNTVDPIAVPAHRTHNRLRSRVAAFSHILFMVWGLAVIIIHVQATMHSRLTGCAMQVRPWFTSKPACALIYVNCKSQNTSGGLAELDELMSQMDEQTLLHIVIRHCSHVEIPPRIQHFPSLLGFKIYNSTLARWDSDAELTAHSHSNIVFLFVVDVNMTRLPDGLLSNDFPQKLLDIEFSGTNLTHIPDELEHKWPNRGLVVFEKSLLQVVPEALVRMQLPYLGLGANRITNIPAQLISNPSAVLGFFDGNPIETLPGDLVASKSLQVLSLGATELEAFPDWFDDQFFQHASVVASESQACSELIASMVSGNSLSSPIERAYQDYQLDCSKMNDYLYYPHNVEESLDARYQ